MNAEEACREIHRLFQILPTYRAPNQVPFTDGLYAFYESGEESEHAPTGRIVRIGNHPRSDGGLVRRLRQHYSGSKNGSAFRKLLGGAIVRAAYPAHPCLSPGPGRGHWERQDGHACQHCGPVEKQVSAILRSQFPFRCVAIPQRGERNRFESLLIATIATCPTCGPSAKWLGLHAYAETVHRSGLWNTQFVDGQTMGKEDLARLAELVAGSVPQAQGLQ